MSKLTPEAELLIIEKVRAEVSRLKDETPLNLSDAQKGLIGEHLEARLSKYWKIVAAVGGILISGLSFLSCNTIQSATQQTVKTELDRLNASVEKEEGKIRDSQMGLVVATTLARLEATNALRAMLALQDDLSRLSKTATNVEIEYNTFIHQFGDIKAFTAAADAFRTNSDAIGDRLVTNGSFQQRIASHFLNVPIGTIVPFAGPASSNTNQFWRLCDGALLSTNEFSLLFQTIGYAWGGSGNVFKLPDLQGSFLRGADNGSGRDPEARSRTPSGILGAQDVGSRQGYATAFPNTRFTADVNGAHQHIFTLDQQDSGAKPSGKQRVFENDSHEKYEAAVTHLTGGSGSHTHAISGGDAETRPGNYAVNYLIRIK